MSKIIKRAMSIAMAAALALMAGCGDKTGSDNQSGTLDVSDASNASSASNASNAATSEADVKSASERVAELAGQIELPSMAEVTADNLSTFLGIDPEKVSEFSAQICKTRISIISATKSVTGTSIMGRVAQPHFGRFVLKKTMEIGRWSAVRAALEQPTAQSGCLNIPGRAAFFSQLGLSTRRTQRPRSTVPERPSTS